MPLIKRYNQVEEYSSMISTSPRLHNNSATLHSRPPRGRQQSEPTLSSNAQYPRSSSSWETNTRTFASEVQDVLRRFRMHANLTQRKAFAFLSPLTLFALLFALAVHALRLPPASVKAVREVLYHPFTHKTVILQNVIFFIGLLVGVLGVLRFLVWLSAKTIDLLTGVDINTTLPTPSIDAGTDQDGDRVSTERLLKGIFA